MIDKPQLDHAFDRALRTVRDCRAAGAKCVDGRSAESNLDRLEKELVEERARALQRGSIDKAWFQKTVRWLVEWVPETELTLIAALGGIARAKPSRSS